MSFQLLDTVKRLEVHARRRGKDDRIFRIWDGKTNTYATQNLTREKAVTRLVELERRAGNRISWRKAEERVQNAAEDGFESLFATTGELNDLWKREHRTIERGII